MATAVVVATVVQTNMSEAALRTAMLDQVRNHERDLLAHLADRGEEANVVTAILNVEEFMNYMLQRLPRPADAAPAPKSERKSELLPHDALPAVPHRTTVEAGEMSEIDFMTAILDEMQTGRRQPSVRLTEADYQALEDETPGAHWGQNPYLY